MSASATIKKYGLEKAFPYMYKDPEKNLPKLRGMIEKTGARSTDMQSPESADHLCAKCDGYAACWAPKAEELWEARKDELARKHTDEVQ